MHGGTSVALRHVLRHAVGRTGGATAIQTGLIGAVALGASLALPHPRQTADARPHRVFLRVVPVGAFSQGIVVDERTSRAFVPDGLGRVQVLDSRTGALLAQIKVGREPAALGLRA